MRTFIAVLLLGLLATTAWANLGLENELADPGFEIGGTWAASGPVNNHLPYSQVSPFGVPKAPNGGNYAGGVAGQSLTFPGGVLRQVVDESQFSGWNPDYNTKIVELNYNYYAMGLGDVSMLINVYLDYMTDGSYPYPTSPNYVRQKVASHVGNSGGWVSRLVSVTLPSQPQWLSVEFEFSYFSGTGVMLLDNLNLQGQCVPEPSSLLALAGGLIGIAGYGIRRKM